MKNIIVIITALICVFLISCDSKVNQQGVATPPPKINSPKPPSEPYSFKDFKLGMTLAEFDNLKSHITYKGKKRFSASRVTNTTIGGTKGQAFFLFDDCGKGLQLALISITIPKTDFSTVKDALISKYGSPTSTENIAKSNAMGATFNCETLIWNNGTSQITAESIGSKIDEADIAFYHLKLGESKQHQEDSAKAKKDI